MEFVNQLTDKGQSTAQKDGEPRHPSFSVKGINNDSTYEER